MSAENIEYVIKCGEDLVDAGSSCYAKARAELSALRSAASERDAANAMLESIRADAMRLFEQEDATRDDEINGWLLETAQMIEADRISREDETVYKPERDAEVERAAFTAGFYAGFRESGEGFNGEYPFDEDLEKMSSDDYLTEKLSAAIRARCANGK